MNMRDRGISCEESVKRSVINKTNILTLIPGCAEEEERYLNEF